MNKMQGLSTDLIRRKFSPGENMYEQRAGSAFSERVLCDDDKRISQSKTLADSVYNCFRAITNTPALVNDVFVYYAQWGDSSHLYAKDILDACKELSSGFLYQGYLSDNTRVKTVAARSLAEAYNRYGMVRDGYPLYSLLQELELLPIEQCPSNRFLDATLGHLAHHFLGEQKTPLQLQISLACAIRRARLNMQAVPSGYNRHLAGRVVSILELLQVHIALRSPNRTIVAQPYLERSKTKDTVVIVLAFTVVFSVIFGLAEAVDARIAAAR